MQDGAERVRQAHQAAFGQMTKSVQAFGDATLSVSSLIAESVLRNMQLEQADAANHATAQASRLATSRSAIKELAIVKAVETFAKGLEALGDFNFLSAARYFASSALYGTIGAAQIASALGAGGGGSVPGPGRQSVGVGGAATTGGRVALAPGAASALKSPASNLTVLVMGEPQAAAWLTKTINQGVLQQDLMLVSSHTKRSAPAGR
jgi:hypothetical protein